MDFFLIITTYVSNQGLKQACLCFYYIYCYFYCYINTLSSQYLLVFYLCFLIVIKCVAFVSSGISSICP